MKRYVHDGTSWVSSKAVVLSQAEWRSSISQFGITWTFDKLYPTGQFVNGDWWVVGPVNIINVDPAPSTRHPDEDDADLTGETGVHVDNAMRNGSQLLDTFGSTGYDSRSNNYNASKSISYPYTLAVNRTLASSKSNIHIPNNHVYTNLMAATIPSETQNPNVMNTAVVLTCLSEIPPTDAFRPPYTGTTKPIFRAGDINWNRLLNLPAPSGASFAQYERYLERVWLDDIYASWEGQWLWPTENQPNYGREYARIVSTAGLLLNTDATQEQKRTLLYRFIQLGIDLAGLKNAGMPWVPDGAHASGRKFPIVFAGIMLDDPYFELTANAVGVFEGLNRPFFAEDAQSYYGQSYFNSTALFQMVAWGGTTQPYQHKLPDTWDFNDNRSDAYRICCTIRAWTGQALCLLLMGEKARWNHNAFFELCDDWMADPDPFAAHRQGFQRSEFETVAWDDFVTDYWHMYRDTVPVQANGADDLMWEVNSRTWVNNPRPS